MEIVLNQPLSFCRIGKLPHQEDARFPDSDRPPTTCRSFVVCDGVGGLTGGDVASRTVCQAIGEYMEHVDLTQSFTSADFKGVLDFAYAKLLHAMRQTTPEMATTLTFLCFHANGALAAHMGDSRIYQIRPDIGILYRSNDHSLVNALVHSGNLTPQEAINHPQRHYITRCLSSAEHGQISSAADVLQITDIAPGDYFFLCSDGVLHGLDDEKLFTLLSSDDSDEEKMDRIAILSQDSSDNNTAFLIPVQSVNNDSKQEIHWVNEDYPIPNLTMEVDTVPYQIEEIAPSEPTFQHRLINFFRKWF